MTAAMLGPSEALKGPSRGHQGLSRGDQEAIKRHSSAPLIISVTHHSEALHGTLIRVLSSRRSYRVRSPSYRARHSSVTVSSGVRHSGKSQGNLSSRCSHRVLAELLLDLLIRVGERVDGAHGLRAQILLHGWQSEAIRGNQRQSEAIRGNQRQSEAIRGTQRHSEAINDTHLRAQVLLETHRARPEHREQRLQHACLE